MSSCCKIYVGDVGALIYVDLKDCDGSALDVSGSVVDLFLTKPITCETIGDLRMSFSSEAESGDRIAATGDGVDGRMVYSTIAGQVDTKGTWRAQPRITTGVTVVWGGEFTFTVGASPA